MLSVLLALLELARLGECVLRQSLAVRRGGHRRPRPVGPGTARRRVVREPQPTPRPVASRSRRLPMTPLAQLLEAALFASGGRVAAEALAALDPDATREEVASRLEELEHRNTTRRPRHRARRGRRWMADPDASGIHGGDRACADRVATAASVRGGARDAGTDRLPAADHARRHRRDPRRVGGLDPQIAARAWPGRRRRARRRHSDGRCSTARLRRSRAFRARVTWASCRAPTSWPWRSTTRRVAAAPAPRTLTAVPDRASAGASACSGPAALGAGGYRVTTRGRRLCGRGSRARQRSSSRVGRRRRSIRIRIRSRSMDRPSRDPAPITWLVLNKPPGVLTTARDETRAGRRTVFDLVPAALRRPGLTYVGRLDYMTEGSAPPDDRWRRGTPAHAPESCGRADVCCHRPGQCDRCRSGTSTRHRARGRPDATRRSHCAAASEIAAGSWSSRLPRAAPARCGAHARLLGLRVERLGSHAVRPDHTRGSRIG